MVYCQPSSSQSSWLPKLDTYLANLLTLRMLVCGFLACLDTDLIRKAIKLFATSGSFGGVAAALGTALRRRKRRRDGKSHRRRREDEVLLKLRL